jgi:hypothetical protein
MPPVNPYSAGGMVIDPAMFFGRDDELRRIRDRLRKGDSTSVVGLQRIGKSSLLYQLAHQADSPPPTWWRYIWICRTPPITNPSAC